MNGKRMSIEQACAAILGTEAAGAILRDQGVRWAVVAAMAVAKRSDDPDALDAINRYRADNVNLS
jgi:hypothetical protein